MNTLKGPIIYGAKVGLPVKLNRKIVGEISKIDEENNDMYVTITSDDDVMYVLHNMNCSMEIVDGRDDFRICPFCGSEY